MLILELQRLPAVGRRRGKVAHRLVLPGDWASNRRPDTVVLLVVAVPHLPLHVQRWNSG